MFGAFGLALAALPNLIVAAVPPRITGEALSFNSMILRISFSLGVQIPATIVAANAVPGTSELTESGFERAFLTASAAMLIAALIALLIPRASGRARAPVDGRSRPARESDQADGR